MPETPRERVEHEASWLLVDAQSTKRKRAESLDERPTEPHEKKRKLRSTVVSEPGQIKANGPKFSSLETELHDLIFEELEIKMFSALASQIGISGRTHVFNFFRF